MTTNQHNREEDFLFGKDKQLPFAVPRGYFDGLAQRILHKIELEQELKEFSVLSAIQKQNHFAVPENYFLENEIQPEPQDELAAFPLLSKIPKPVFKPLTEEYTNELSQKVFKQFEIAGELKAYTTLAAINKQNAFEVSPDYFDSVADKVKERYHAANVLRESVLDQLLAIIFKPKMAIAYSLIILIGAGTFMYFNQSPAIPKIPSGDCKTLACIEKKELLKSLDEENLYDLVDADQLDEQFSGSDSDSPENNNADSLPIEFK